MTTSDSDIFAAIEKLPLSNAIFLFSDYPVEDEIAISDLVRASFRDNSAGDVVDFDEIASLQDEDLLFERLASQSLFLTTECLLVRKIADKSVIHLTSRLKESDDLLRSSLLVVFLAQRMAQSIIGEFRSSKHIFLHIQNKGGPYNSNDFIKIARLLKIATTDEQFKVPETVTTVYELLNLVRLWSLVDRTPTEHSDPPDMLETARALPNIFSGVDFHSILSASRTNRLGGRTPEAEVASIIRSLLYSDRSRSANSQPSTTVIKQRLHELEKLLRAPRSDPSWSRFERFLARNRNHPR